MWGFTTCTERKGRKQKRKNNKKTAACASERQRDGDSDRKGAERVQSKVCNARTHTSVYVHKRACAQAHSHSRQTRDEKGDYSPVNSV